MASKSKPVSNVSLKEPTPAAPASTPSSTGATPTSSSASATKLLEASTSSGILSTVPSRPLRTSVSTPSDSLFYYLNGGGRGTPGSRIGSAASRASTKDGDAADDNLPHPSLCSRWIYHVALVVLMMAVIGLATFALYLELIAYLADSQWNSILALKSSFPTKAVVNDTIFAGRRWTAVTSLFHPHTHPGVDHTQSGTCNGTNTTNIVTLSVDTSLRREITLETAHLALLCAAILGSSLSLATYVCSGFVDWWRRLQFTYLSHSAIGAALALGAILVIYSAIVHIPRGFVHIRAKLEDEWDNPCLDIHEHHTQDWPEPTMNCTVGRKDLGEESLQKLLDLVKTCVYLRYVQMNYRDPCRKVKIRKEISLVKDGKERNYSMVDLERLTLCPMDDFKIVGALFTLMAALLSWIIMYVGSFAAKRFFPYHSYSLDKSLYKPGGVSPIDDLTARPRTSSQESIPSLYQLHFGKRESIGTPSLGLSERRGGVLGSNESSMRDRGQHHGPGGGSIMSIMRVAPKMIIRPPDDTPRAAGSHSAPGAGRGRGRVTQEKAKPSEWFTDGM